MADELDWKFYRETLNDVFFTEKDVIKRLDSINLLGLAV
jgi:hypothetical protein